MSTRPEACLHRTTTRSQPRFVCTRTTSPTATSGRGLEARLFVAGSVVSPGGSRPDLAGDALPSRSLPRPMSSSFPKDPPRPDRAVVEDAPPFVLVELAMESATLAVFTLEISWSICFPISFAFGFGVDASFALARAFSSSSFFRTQSGFRVCAPVRVSQMWSAASKWAEYCCSFAGVGKRGLNPPQFACSQSVRCAAISSAISYRSSAFWARFTRDSLGSRRPSARCWNCCLTSFLNFFFVWVFRFRRLNASSSTCLLTTWSNSDSVAKDGA
mmetsp:Transcript_125432/g.287331  ORF Transcript_125432/g.287331 Transcript_125432/m.287331 type:complete len:273 (-) Transcript_125432:45-863(-)